MAARHVKVFFLDMATRHVVGSAAMGRKAIVRGPDHEEKRARYEAGRKVLGLSKEKLAWRLGVSGSSGIRYENGKTPVPDPVLKLLDRLLLEHWNAGKARTKPKGLPNPRKARVAPDLSKTQQIPPDDWDWDTDEEKRLGRERMRAMFANTPVAGIVEKVLQEQAVKDAKRPKPPKKRSGA